MKLKLLSIAGLASIAMSFSTVFAQGPPNAPCGNVLNFDGVDDMVSFSDSPLQASGTFETWINKADWSDHVDDIIFGNNIGFSSDNSLYLSLHNVVGLHMRYGGQAQANNMFVSSNDSKNLVDGTWHHIAASWSNDGLATTLEIYLDGVKLDSATANITIDPGTMFQLGSNPQSLYLKNAMLDETRVWDHRRTEQEIMDGMQLSMEGQEPGLVANYNANHLGGGLLDNAGSNHGMLNGFDLANAWTLADGSAPCAPMPPNGDCGTTLTFDGTNNTVQIPHSTLLKPSSEITIEAWVYPVDITTATFYEIYRKDDAGFRHLLSFQEHGTILSFGANVAGSYSELDVTIDPAEFVGEWIHIAATFDGSVKKVFKNGVEIGQEVVGGALGVNGNSAAYIGSNNNGSEFFDGRIDEVKIWDKALSPVEMTWSMFTMLSGSESGLLAYWDFEEGPGSSMLGDLANGNNGTLINHDIDNDWVRPDGSPLYAMTTLDTALVFGDTLWVGANWYSAPGAYMDTIWNEGPCGTVQTTTISMWGWPDNGMCGTYFSYDGVNNNVRLDAPLTIGSSSNTVELWVKVPLAGTEGLGSTERVGNILGNFNDSPNANWEIHDDGQIRLYWNGGQVDVLGTTDLRDNKWHHLAFVRDINTNNIKGYIDGLEEFSHNSAGSNITFTTRHRIGSDNRGGSAPEFHGAMDELRIWNVALSKEEIAAKAAWAVDPQSAGLVDYFDFNQTGRQTWVENLASSNHGEALGFDAAAEFIYANGNPITHIAALVSQDASCWGLEDGSIEVIGTGGSGPLMYSINSVDYVATMVFNVPADTFIVTVQDTNMCWDTSMVIIEQPMAVDTSVSQFANELTANALNATYQWLDCDDNMAPLVGMSTQMFTAAISGNYAVELTTGASCKDTSACVQVIVTGTQSMLEQNLELYPNPVTDQINISLGQTGLSGMASLVDARGNVITEVEILGQNDINFDLSQPSGIYFVKIVTAADQTMIKVVKE